MSAAQTQTIAERLDVHKSCKTLETVVNVLNDYCEAANAIVGIQKKLAKALRETASTKCTAEIAANAFNASASIFEALSELDNKFAKYADKECDGVSAEVKKWFRKLNKEERAHDEKIANASAKIKQAGQAYERKAKKNPREAEEEHTRYINLLSNMGSEVTQEKHNHALFVSQRHTATLHSIAASLSRVADAEWLRACEGVRRFSPTIGQLGQWRALCEGSWTGALPADLPDVDAPQIHAKPKDLVVEMDGNAGKTNINPVPSPAPAYSDRQISEQDRSTQGTNSRAVTPSGPSPAAPPRYPSDVVDRPPPLRDQLQTDTLRVGGQPETPFASLSSFPSPPNHFPLPPVANSKFGVRPSDNAYSAVEHRAHLAVSSTNARTLARDGFHGERLSTSSGSGSQESPAVPLDTSAAPALTAASEIPSLGTQHARSDRENAGVLAPLHTQVGAEPSASSSSGGLSNMAFEVPSKAGGRAIHVHETQSDAQQNNAGQQRDRLPVSTTPTSQLIERADTGKSSIVASLRDRYSRSDGPSSPQPKDVPRLPLSVSSLASKYQSVGSPPESPRHGPRSPTEERRRASSDANARLQQSIASARASPPAARRESYAAGLPPPTASDLQLRRQRIEELEELELREQEIELRLREREIEQKTRVLEKERQRLYSARGVRPDGYMSDSSSRPPITNRPQVESPSASPTLQTRPLHSYSTTHLVPPTSSSNSRTPASQPSSPLDRGPPHAPYCGCEKCSASKYGARNPAPSTRDLRPPEPPITLRPEKPKGWIRRLSMPVMGGAFSLDSKKGISSAGIAGGMGYRNSFAFPEEDGRLVKDLGALRNRSTTNLG